MADNNTVIHMLDYESEPELYDTEKLGDMVNELSAVAASMVHEYAMRFLNKEEYRPLEFLARRMQAAVVYEGARRLHDARC